MIVNVLFIPVGSSIGYSATANNCHGGFHRSWDAVVEIGMNAVFSFYLEQATCLQMNILIIFFKVSFTTASEVATNY